MPQNDLIEQLTHAQSVRQFLILACDALACQLDSLVERVFRKTDFALKSVVDSLFEHQGPLAERSVKLKLLLGLGVISAELYQDLTACFESQILSLHDELAFSDQRVLAFAEKLHAADVSQIHALTNHLPKIDDIHSMQRQMQQLRIERMVRSCLILAVVEIVEQLDCDSPL